MEQWILNLISNNGLAAGLVIAMFLYFKLNDFKHISGENKQQSLEHRELKELGIKNLEKNNDIKEILIRIEEHLRNKLNGK